MNEEKRARKNNLKSMDEFDQPNGPIFGQVNARNVLPKDER